MPSAEQIPRCLDFMPMPDGSHRFESDFEFVAQLPDFSQDFELSDEYQDLDQRNVHFYTVNPTGCGISNESSSVPGKTSSEVPSSSSAESETRKETAVVLRRRAQNRASQRAFRQRKDKHIQCLKHTLDLLATKHFALQDSHKQQSNVIKQLRARMAEINAELNAIRSTQEKRSAIEDQNAYNWDNFAAFDAFTFTVTSGSPGANPQPIILPADCFAPNDPLLPQMERWRDPQWN